MSDARTLGWPGVFRLALVQASLGAVVVLTTSTLNRVMVVELALPAALPGFLVALHYFVQLSRPRFGHESDRGGRRIPWIVGGMAVLGLGGFIAATSTAVMASSTLGGVALATFAFLLIGAGVGACGTSLLVLLATSVAPERRAPAATLTWVMMIASFAITATVAGHFLDPFSFERLMVVTGTVSVLALAVTILATWGLESSAAPQPDANAAVAGAVQPGSVSKEGRSFGQALREVLSESHTRAFALFVFISMLAYSAQDLVLEPFAGAVYGLTPGESTQLGGKQHAGVLLGMLLVAVLGRLAGERGQGILRACLVLGCIASAALIAALALSGVLGPPWPLEANVFLLGAANGAYAVAAIGSMMTLVSEGAEGHDGTRMGVWGAAQAIAFGLGGLAGTGAVDLVRWASDSVVAAYGVVFCAQAALFLAAGWLAARMPKERPRRQPGDLPTAPLAKALTAVKSQ
jgi:BCD family chlorophyll transporter-like MFS transporter